MRTRGPSPRGRGAVGEAGGRGPLVRTIPARAGSSGTARCRRIPHGDHPRAGGEQGLARNAALVAEGPSPRGRGAAGGRQVQRHGQGTIPARAGSRWARCRGRGACRDHPRAGGEQVVRLADLHPSVGPSPRGRGAEVHADRPRLVPGTIPARAGSRGRGSARRRRPRDHPRAGGEQRPTLLGPSTAAGPSPRGRGAQRRPDRALHGHGTIPARAGSRRGGPSGRGGAGDHPRAGGEQRTHVRVATAEEGPSPRGRGAAARRRDSWPLRGTIPARAGSSGHSPPSSARRRDHPRAGGEQHQGRDAVKPDTGPSPRGRGAELHHTRQRQQPGTIPARAGSRRGRGPYAPC